MEYLVNLYANYYGLPSLLSISKGDYSTFTYSSTPELKKEIVSFIGTVSLPLPCHPSFPNT